MKILFCALAAVLITVGCDISDPNSDEPEPSIVGVWTRADDGPAGILVLRPDSSFVSIVREFGHADGNAVIEHDQVVLYGYICRGRPGEYSYVIDSDTLMMTVIMGGCAYGLHGAWVRESVSIASS